MPCDALEEWDGGGGREFQEGGDMCIHMADSHCCTPETKTVLLKHLYSDLWKKEDGKLEAGMVLYLLFLFSH